MSEIKTNKLTGTSTAGVILVTGEGNSTTTNLQQGLAKSWLNMNGTGTVAARDSLNISSIVDNSAGRYGPVLTSAMGNTNYSLTGTSNLNSGDTFSAPGNLVLGMSLAIATTTSTYEASNYVSSYVDSKYVFTQVFGDLA
tara:strand:+ start:90 stop:509 length:420 start_codon:yes stop_codon:yes gene_type:complete